MTKFDKALAFLNKYKDAQVKDIIEECHVGRSLAYRAFQEFKKKKKRKYTKRSHKVALSTVPVKEMTAGTRLVAFYGNAADVIQSLKELML